MKLFKYLLVSSIIYCFPAPGYSLEAPNLSGEVRDTIPDFLSVQPPRPITPRPYEFPEPEIPPQPKPPLVEPQPIPPPSSPNIPDIPGTIIIKEFKFSGHTVFSSQTLVKSLESFTNKEITFAQLLEAEQTITNLYIEAGYINSGAVISAGQTFDPQGAIVTITIIEGSIKEIEVTGLTRLDPNYVKSRLAIATSKPFNVNNLYEALQLLQLDPLIETISAELAAGVRPEESLLSVRVTQADSLSLIPIFNNGRSPSVGSFRRGITIKEDNLFGFGDGIDVSYANTDGSDAVNGSYTIPVNPYNGKVRISGGFNSTRVIQAPFDVLDITGQSDYYEISFSQPVVQHPEQEFTLGLTVTIESSQSFLGGEPFPLSLGAEINGNTDVTALRFFQDWTVRQPNEVFALRSQFSFGLEAFGATINEVLPDSRFFTWRNQAQYVRQLAPDTLWVARTDLQVSSETLVPLEQFSLGGLSSVRGYPQDILLTDNGLLLSSEVWLPVWRVENIIDETDGVLQIIPFFELGIGWNAGIFPNPNPNTLVGVGLGVQWQMGSNFSARLDWGIPLVNIDVERNTLNDQGIYFNINARF
jgi:hemolysin activation/secretion protein